MNDEKTDYKAQKINKNVWHKKLSEPETDNLIKDMRWTKKYIKNNLLIQIFWLLMT